MIILAIVAIDHDPASLALRLGFVVKQAKCQR